MDCDFRESSVGWWQCKRCGRRMKSQAKPRSNCSNGLGDRVERVLSRVGITETRYKKLKRRLGLSGKCGCKGRKRRLNEIGEKLWQFAG